MRTWCSIPGLTQWVKNPALLHKCRSEDPELLAATAPIRPLAWELPCAAGVAQKKKVGFSLSRIVFILASCKVTAKQPVVPNDPDCCPGLGSPVFHSRISIYL